MERTSGRSRRSSHTRGLLVFAAGVASLSVTASLVQRDTLAVASSTPPEPPSTAGAQATPSQSAPVRSGRIVRATPADAVQKVAALADGEILELEDGSYQGLYDVTANDTTIRAVNRNAAVFVQDGRFILNGRNTVVQGLQFQSQVAPVIELRSSGQIIVDNLFEGAGDGRDGSSVGIITIRNPTPGWDAAAGPDGLNPPIVLTAHRVEANTFNHPRNTVYWQSHGVTHNVFSHNTMQGPHAITGGRETEAVKLGFGFGAEDTFTEISYNTINDWTAWPYVIGIKSSSVQVRNNLLTKGRLQIRYGHRNVLSANVILDGDIHAGGDSNVIADNYVRTINPVDNFGPLTLFGRSGLVNSVGDYSGRNGRPPFILEFSNGQVTGNTFISLGPDAATVTNIWYDDPILEFPMRNTTFSQNRLYRTSSTGFIGTAMRNGGATGPINQQSFLDNSYFCPTICDLRTIPEKSEASSPVPFETTTRVLLTTTPTVTDTRPTPSAPPIVLTSPTVVVGATGTTAIAATSSAPATSNAPAMTTAPARPTTSAPTTTMAPGTSTISDPATTAATSTPAIIPTTAVSVALSVAIGETNPGLDPIVTGPVVKPMTTIVTPTDEPRPAISNRRVGGGDSGTVGTGAAATGATATVTVTVTTTIQHHLPKSLSLRAAPPRRAGQPAPGRIVPRRRTTPKATRKPRNIPPQAKQAAPRLLPIEIVPTRTTPTLPLFAPLTRSGAGQLH
jgi:hypothetical protein